MRSIIQLSSGSLDVVLFCWLRERRPHGDVMFSPCCQAGVREASVVLREQLITPIDLHVVLEGSQFGAARAGVEGENTTFCQPCENFN